MCCGCVWLRENGDVVVVVVSTQKWGLQQCVVDVFGCVKMGLLLLLLSHVCVVVGDNIFFNIFHHFLIFHFLYFSCKKIHDAWACTKSCFNAAFQ